MITVLNPGIYCTIQDLGRIGFAHIGVPISGAMDLHSASIGNQLLNNKKSAAVLEIPFGGCKLQFETVVTICLTGADFNPTIDGELIALNSVFKVAKGAILSFGSRKYGVRTYLCVLGGFDAETVLKSSSYYKGVTARSYLQKGDTLCVGFNNPIKQKSHAKIKVDVQHFSTNKIRVTKGPEFELLSKNQQNALLKGVFTVSKDNNRVGYQLEESLENELKPILTSGVLPGTVQLTPSGKLIVLMRDCQVTGGYPRILQLLDNATSKLGQKIAGDEVQFWLEE